MSGALAVVLHHHLPYIRHPEHPFFMEERWLFEAITETYLPLISSWRRLEQDRIPFRFTCSMTPPLCNMLRDELLVSRYRAHMAGLLELADKEVLRTADDPDCQKVARFYRHRLRNLLDLFEAIGGDVVGEYRRLQDRGCLEIITCTATHGFLPLMGGDRRAMRAQIEIACQDYAKHFGRRPKGIWLAECGYVPQVDELLSASGLRYFLVDSHAILHASAAPVFGVHAPLHCPRTGVAAFARDPESSRQVWSSEEGYPGDALYREYYRDIGFDLDLDYVGPYVHPDGIRMNTGLKYHRITGKTDQKAIYDPEAAQAKAAEHAGNFMFNRQAQVRYLSEHMGREPLVVSPYDAELFGHWWYEGPEFLEALCRHLANGQTELELTTPLAYLDKYPANQTATPGHSSWGGGGYSKFWCNSTNEWIYPLLHNAQQRMGDLAERYETSSEQQARALNQALRELLLAQASDWAFIMQTGTTVEYAVKRTREHLAAFHALLDGLEAGQIDAELLDAREDHWRIFPELDYRVFSAPPPAQPQKPKPKITRPDLPFGF